MRVRRRAPIKVVAARRVAWERRSAKSRSSPGANAGNVVAERVGCKPLAFPGGQKSAGLACMPRRHHGYELAEALHGRTGVSVRDLDDPRLRRPVSDEALQPGGLCSFLVDGVEVGWQKPGTEAVDVATCVGAYFERRRQPVGEVLPDLERAVERAHRRDVRVRPPRRAR